MTCDRLQQAAGRGWVLRDQLLPGHEGAQLIRQAGRPGVPRAHHHLVHLLQLLESLPRQRRCGARLVCLRERQLPLFACKYTSRGLSQLG